jgi:glutaminyl-tRNA synthetase
LNAKSLTVQHGFVERAIVESNAARFQFERIGYFCKDAAYRADKPIFNRTVALREDAGKDLVHKDAGRAAVEGFSASVAKP